MRCAPSRCASHGKRAHFPKWRWHFVAVGRETTKGSHANEAPSGGLSRAASRRVGQRSAIACVRLKSLDREESVSVFYIRFLEDARHYQAGHQGV